MRFKKGSLLLFIFTLLLISCSTTDPIVVYGKVNITANGYKSTNFEIGEEIKVQVEVLEILEGYKFYWSTDGENFEEDNILTADSLFEKTFGPFDAEGRNPVYVKVEFGNNSITDSLILKIGGTPVQWNGALSVSGTKIINQEGKAIQLRGMSTHGLQYFNSFYTEMTVQALAEKWKADIIRISSYVDEGWGDHGNYLQQPDYWKSRVDSIVEWATDFGIYALIDWHHLVPGNPNDYLEEAKDFFEYMADKHGSKENVLFDICNEPNNDSAYDNSWNSLTYKNPVDWNVIKTYAEQIIPIIRKKSNNIIIVGTSDWASRPDLVASSKLYFSNVMYSMHFYAADHKTYFSYLESAISKGIPVFITEFGTQSADGDQANNFIESKKWIDYLQENKISWCNWNFSYDHRSGAVFESGVTLNTLDDYIDNSNLKEAGEWILDKIQNPPDDF